MALSKPGGLLGWLAVKRNAPVGGRLPLEDIEEGLRKHCTQNPLTDATFCEIAKLLEHIDELFGNEHPWKRSPRTFAVLFMIDSTRWMSHFTKTKTDFDLPYNYQTWPVDVKDRELQERFLGVQDKVLTSAYDLENGTGSHQHLSTPADAYFLRMKRLGRGGYGLVDLVYSRLSHREFARKIVSRGRGSEAKGQHKAIVDELEVVKKLSHRHLVRYIGSYTDNDYIAYLMEPIADYDLQKYLLRRKGRTIIRDFYGCLAGAVHYIHKQHVRHADITSKNILVKADCVYLSDFGAARDCSFTGKNTTQHNIPFNIDYVAPEVVRQEPRNYKSDMWSLGVVFLELTTVLQGRQLKEFWKYMDTEARNKRHPRSLQANLPEANSWLDKITSRLDGDSMANEPIAWVKALLEENAEHRPSSKQLMSLIHATPSFQRFCCLQCRHDFEDGDFEYELESAPVPVKHRKDRSGTDELLASAAAMLFKRPVTHKPMDEKRIAGIESWMSFTHDPAEHSSSLAPEISSFGRGITESPAHGSECSWNSRAASTKHSQEDDSTEVESSDVYGCVSKNENRIADSGRGYVITTAPDSSDEEGEPWFRKRGYHINEESDSDQDYLNWDQSELLAECHRENPSLKPCEINQALELLANDSDEISEGEETTPGVVEQAISGSATNEVTLTTTAISHGDTPLESSSGFESTNPRTIVNINGISPPVLPIKIEPSESAACATLNGDHRTTHTQHPLPSDRCETDTIDSLGALAVNVNTVASAPTGSSGGASMETSPENLASRNGEANRPNSVSLSNNELADGDPLFTVDPKNSQQPKREPPMFRGQADKDSKSKAIPDTRMPSTSRDESERGESKSAERSKLSDQPRKIPQKVIKTTISKPLGERDETEKSEVKSAERSKLSDPPRKIPQKVIKTTISKPLEKRDETEKSEVKSAERSKLSDPPRKIPQKAIKTTIPKPSGEFDETEKSNVKSSEGARMSKPPRQISQKPETETSSMDLAIRDEREKGQIEFKEEAKMSKPPRHTSKNPEKRTLPPLISTDGKEAKDIVSNSQAQSESAKRTKTAERSEQPSVKLEKKTSQIPISSRGQEDPNIKINGQTQSASKEEAKVSNSPKQTSEKPETPQKETTSIPASIHGKDDKNSNSNGHTQVQSTTGGKVSKPPGRNMNNPKTEMTTMRTSHDRQEVKDSQSKERLAKGIPSTPCSKPENCPSQSQSAERTKIQAFKSPMPTSESYKREIMPMLIPNQEPEDEAQDTLESVISSAARDVTEWSESFGQTQGEYSLFGHNFMISEPEPLTPYRTGSKLGRPISRTPRKKTLPLSISPHGREDAVSRPSAACDKPKRSEGSGNTPSESNLGTNMPKRLRQTSKNSGKETLPLNFAHEQEDEDRKSYGMVDKGIPFATREVLERDENIGQARRESTLEAKWSQPPRTTSDMPETGARPLSNPPGKISAKPKKVAFPTLMSKGRDTKAPESQTIEAPTVDANRSRRNQPRGFFFQRPQRKAQPRLFPESFMDSTRKKSNIRGSVASSAMTEGTREKLKKANFHPYLDRTLGLLENWCKEGKPGPVKALLASGSNPGTSKTRRPYPLLNAVQGASKSHNRCVEYLLRYGANPHIVRGSGGKSLLHLAIENKFSEASGYINLINMLVFAGLDPNAPDGNGEYPLQKIFKGPDTTGLADHKLEAMALLLQSETGDGTDVNIKVSGTWDTPLHMAVQRRSPMAVAMLLTKGADVNSVNSIGSTPLLSAALTWRIELRDEEEQILELLSGREEIDLDATSGVKRRTALHLAALAGAVTAVGILLENGADPRKEDADGNTPIMLLSPCAGRRRASAVAKDNDTRELLMGALGQVTGERAANTTTVPSPRRTLIDDARELALAAQGQVTGNHEGESTAVSSPGRTWIDDPHELANYIEAQGQVIGDQETESTPVRSQTHAFHTAFWSPPK